MCVRRRGLCQTARVERGDGQDGSPRDDLRRGCLACLILHRQMRILRMGRVVDLFRLQLPLLIQPLGRDELTGGGVSGCSGAGCVHLKAKTNTDTGRERRPTLRGEGKLGKLCRAGDRALQLLVLNEEFLVSASQQLALITSLPFVHTARRYYRLNGLVRLSDWI